MNFAAAFWAKNVMQLIAAPTLIGIFFYLSGDADVVGGICVTKKGITPYLLAITAMTGEVHHRIVLQRELH